MEKKSIKELNLVDDFLFGTMVSYPKLGEEFCRKILKIILDRDVEHLRVIPQKVYFGKNTNLHGTRLDVYLEEEDAENLVSENVRVGSVYDVESDKNNSPGMKRSLPKRVRFYRAKIDEKCLKAGENYENLKNVIIIMITTYDPFDRGRMIYTVKNQCVEEPDMEYSDGALNLYLYTKGTKGNPPEQLKQLLRYLEDTTPENAVNETLQSIQKMVETVKHDEEVSLEYMKIFEREQMLLEQGREQGIKVVIEMCEEASLSWEDTMRKVQEKFSVSEGKAREYMECYWGKKDGVNI